MSSNCQLRVIENGKTEKLLNGKRVLIVDIEAGSLDGGIKSIIHRLRDRSALRVSVYESDLGFYHNVFGGRLGDVLNF